MIEAHYTRSGRFVPVRRVLVVGDIIPAERYPGHHDDPANLRTMCLSCNNSQRDLTDTEWQAAKAARVAAAATSAVVVRDYSSGLRSSLPRGPRSLVVVSDYTRRP